MDTNSIIELILNISHIQGEHNQDYTIDVTPEGIVNILRKENGNTSLHPMAWGVVITEQMEKLPVKFGKIEGYFHIEALGLTTLENCPDYVAASFSCSHNPLQNLSGAPKFISGECRMEDCNISSCHDIPKNCKSYFLKNNNITSLEGLVTNNQCISIDVSHNYLKNLHNCPPVQYLFINNQKEQIQTLKGIPSTIEHIVLDTDTPVLLLLDTNITNFNRLTFVPEGDEANRLKEFIEKYKKSGEDLDMVSLAFELKAAGLKKQAKL